jgi:hypothetical protein
MIIKSTRVQAHQDEKKIPGQILSDAALRNIKVDSITEDYLLDRRQPQTSVNAAHVDAQAISICIQGTRVTGRYKDAIRESIDGSYLREDLSAKHDWPDSMWSCIDWYSHERHLKVLNGASLYQRLKFIHDWQPTNSQKFKFMKSDGASIELCPCCKTTPEDHDNILHGHGKMESHDCGVKICPRLTPMDQFRLCYTTKNLRKSKCHRKSTC